MKNGEAVIVAAGNDDNSSNSLMIDLKVGDTVWLQMSLRVKGTMVGVRSEPEYGIGDCYHSTFTGYIIDSCWSIRPLIFWKDV